VANIVQPTPIGQLIQLDDGTTVNLPDHIAQQQFPELFPQPQQAVGNIPQPGMPQAPPMPENVPYAGAQAGPEPLAEPPPPPAQHDPAATQPAAGFGLPPGVSSMSMEVSGPVQTGPAKLYDTVGFAQQSEDILQPVEADIRARAAEAEKQRADLVAADYNDQARLYEEQAALDRKDAEAIAGIRAEQQAKLETEQANIQEAWDSVGAVNPNRIWENTSDFGKAALGFSTFIDGMLSFQRDGKNATLDWVNQQVERDIRVQEANIQTSKERAMSMERGYDRLSTFYNNRAAWREEQKAYRLQSFANEIKAKGLRFQSVLTQEDYKKSALALEAQAVESYRAANEMIIKGAQEQNKLLTDIYGQQQATYRTKLQLRAEEAARAAASKPMWALSTNTGITDPASPGGFYVARDKAEHDALATLATNNNNTMAEYKALLTFLGTDPSAMSPEDRKRLDAFTTRILNAKDVSLSRSTESDVMRMKAAAGGDPTKFADLFLQDASAAAILQDTMASEQGQYRERVLNIVGPAANRLQIGLPKGNPELSSRMAPPGPKEADRALESVEALDKAVKTPGKNKARLAAEVEKFRDTVEDPYAKFDSGDLKKLDDQIAKISRLPLEDRLVVMQYGDDPLPRKMDLLLVLKTERVKAEAYAGRSAEVSGSDTGAVPLLRAETEEDRAQKAREVSLDKYGGLR
jgi:hypothetical protein